MIYIEALEDFSVPKGFISIFLAGGITGTKSWQTILIDLLKNNSDKLVIFNPRRRNFPINDPSAAEAQIKWEYKYLRKVDIISFWFPKETLCPITLFELGQHSMTNKHLVVGTDPEYARKHDVKIQLSLIRPGIELADNIEVLAQMIRYWYGMLRV